MKRAALAAVALLIAALLLAFVEPGFRDGHDITAHVTYVYLFDHAIRGGQFPVRWVEGVMDGYSQPLFNFYQVGFYYLVELVHLVVPRLSRALTLTVGLSWWMGAWFMYLLFRRLGALPAALGALVFTCSPYLLQDIFVRAAYPELIAIAVAPGLLWSIDRLLRTARPRYVASTAVLAALLVICHLPVAVIIAPAVALFVLVAWIDGEARPRAIALLAVATVLALGLSAFYVLPAIAEMPLVNMRELTTDAFDFHNAFVPASAWGAIWPGPREALTFGLGISQMLILAAAVTALAAGALRGWRRPDPGALTLWLTVVAFALFMMNDRSRAVWEHVSALSFLQFPYRYSLLVSLGCGALAATLLGAVPNERAQAAVVFVAVLAYVPLYTHYEVPPRPIPIAHLNIDDPGWRHTNAAETRWFITHGYDPKGITAVPAERIGRWTLDRGQGRVTETDTRDERVTLAVESDAGVRLRINSHYFPGWGIWIDGQPAPFAVDPDYDFMTVDVPAGRHEVLAAFRNTPVRTAANALTVVSAVLLLCSGVWLRRAPLID